MDLLLMTEVAVKIRLKQSGGQLVTTIGVSVSKKKQII